jgi:hypothetical protein
LICVDKPGVYALVSNLGLILNSAG